MRARRNFSSPARVIGGVVNIPWTHRFLESALQVKARHFAGIIPLGGGQEYLGCFLLQRSACAGHRRVREGGIWLRFW